MNRTRFSKQLQSRANHVWGHRLVRFCGLALVLSSLAKFLHPPRVVAYMASMGYEGVSFYVIAAMELTIAILYLATATRPVGQLLVSSYLGGAVAAHVAAHHSFVGGPFLVYMAHHPYVGACVPGGLLALSWLGPYLLRLEPLVVMNESGEIRGNGLPSTPSPIPAGSTSAVGISR